MRWSNIDAMFYIVDSKMIMLQNQHESR